MQDTSSAVSKNMYTTQSMGRCITRHSKMVYYGLHLYSTIQLKQSHNMVGLKITACCRLLHLHYTLIPFMWLQVACSSATQQSILCLDSVSSMAYPHIPAACHALWKVFWRIHSINKAPESSPSPFNKALQEHKISDPSPLIYFTCSGTLRSL